MESFWLRLKKLEKVIKAIKAQRIDHITFTMGHDFIVVDDRGCIQIEIIRSMSGNYHDLWKLYDFHPQRLESMKSDFVKLFLEQVLEVIESDNVELMNEEEMKKSVQRNPNFPWGMKDEHTRLDNETRKRIFMYQLSIFRSVAEKYPDCRWYGDNTIPCHQKYQTLHVKENGQIVPKQFSCDSTKSYFDFS